MRTFFGEHALEAYVDSAGSKRKIEMRLIDARLNLLEGKAPFLPQKFSQIFCAEKAFAVEGRQFKTVFRQVHSVDVLENNRLAMLH